MDRLIRIDQSKTILIRVEPGQKYCNGKITLHNMMHTMPVAFKLQPLIKSLYTVKPQSGIISPLATLTIDITYHLNSSSSTLLPHSNDSFLLHSVLVPGAAIKEPSSMFDAVPAEWFKKKLVFIDSSIKVMFVGSHILVKLLAHAAMHNKSKGKEPNVMEEIRLVLEKSDPSWRLVNSTDSQGETLLHMAIAQGRPDLVQLLLEFEPDIEIPNRSGYSALETASACNEALIVELLLAHKANTERSESAMYGPIHHATRGGHVEVLRLLLLKGANVDSLTKDGNTALHIGVEEHRRDCVRLLLANGARTDAKNQREGDTPLHVASAIGDENMVKLLLQNGGGASKYVLNGQGKTAYNVAVENGHGRLYDALCLGDKLCMAARKGEVRGIEKVLERGAGINGRDQHGWTALHRASLKGRMEGVKILVEKGVDVDAKDDEGYTALHCAVESGHADVTEFLVKKGADVEARTDKGVSALQIAESLHYVGITRVLLNGGASRDNKIINNSFVDQVVEAALKMEDGDVLKKKKKNMRGGRGGARFQRSMALPVL